VTGRLKPERSLPTRRSREPLPPGGGQRADHPDLRAGWSCDHAPFGARNGGSQLPSMTATGDRFLPAAMNACLNVCGLTCLAIPRGAVAERKRELRRGPPGGSPQPGNGRGATIRLGGSGNAIPFERGPDGRDAGGVRYPRTRRAGGTRRNAALCRACAIRAAPILRAGHSLAAVAVKGRSLRSRRKGDWRKRQP
jgi:hypothetical protein